MDNLELPGLYHCECPIYLTGEDCSGLYLLFFLVNFALGIFGSIFKFLTDNVKQAEAEKKRRKEQARGKKRKKKKRHR